MTDVLERLSPFEVRPSGLLVPEQYGITYPGNDAWLELEANVAAPANAIINPGFEADTSGWTAISGASIARSVGEHHSGLASLQVIVSPAADAKGAYYAVACGANQQWHGGIWVKAPAGATLALWILTGGTNGNQNFTATGGWDYVQADAITGPSDTSIRLQVQTNGSQAVTFYLDDADLAGPAWAMVETTPDTGGTPNKTFTPGPNTTNIPVVSTAQKQFGSGSILCSNSGLTAMQTPDSPDWSFGAGDFTIEGWYYITTVRKCLFAQRAVGGAAENAWEMTMDAGTSADQRLTFYWCASTGDGTTFTAQNDFHFTGTLNVWYHLCCLRIGNVLRAFANGVQLDTDVAITGALRESSAPLTIFGDNRSAGSNDYRGYADEIRISKGIARYTGTSFTPPTSPFTRDQYTVLLIHGDGTDGAAMIDSSGQAGSPFDPGTDPAWMEVER